MPKLLIVAPHFAPANTPDGQRVRLLLPHLTHLGWECTVLTVDASAVASPQEMTLLVTLPPDADIRRVSAIGIATGRRFGVGNLGWRALPWLWREGSRLLARGKFDLVYFSTTQFACLPLGRWWRWRFGIPYVIDLQDPWRNDFYARPGAPPPPGGWKYRLAAAFASIAEAWTLRKCAKVIAVSPDYLLSLGKRYSWFTPKKVGIVIPFGWSKRDLEIAAHLHIPSVQPPTDRQRTLLVIGRVGDDMLSGLYILFSGLARWRSANSCRPGVRVLFIGTSYDPQAGHNSTVARAASATGVAEMVEERPTRIGYLTALATQQQADANLILGSADAGYSPSKIWPLLAAGRPWLAITGRGTTLKEILMPYESPMGCCIDPGDGEASIKACENFFRSMSEGKPISAHAGSVDVPAGLAAYEAAALARRHQEIFDSIVS